MLAGRRSARFAAGAAFAVMATAWLGLFTPSADAHALLLRSVPADNAALTSSPARIVMSFTENPDPRLSHVEVVDSHAHQVSGVSAVQAVPGRPLQLAVTLSSPLPKGWYTVHWLTVSALDGHTATGLFVFGVGIVPPKVSDFGVVFGHTPMGLTVAAALGRWLLYLGLALMVGCAVTVLLALQGALPPGGRVVLRIAWLLAALGAATMTIAEEHVVGAPSLLPFFQTQTGLAYFTLCTAVLAGCTVAVGFVEFLPGRVTLWALGAVGAVTVLLHTLAGHADAPSPFRLVHLVEQWLHMLAVGVWIGGLVWLLLALRPKEGPDRHHAVRRFSRMAGYPSAWCCSPASCGPPPRSARCTTAAPATATRCCSRSLSC